MSERIGLTKILKCHLRDKIRQLWDVQEAVDVFTLVNEYPKEVNEDLQALRTYLTQIEKTLAGGLEEKL